MNPEFIEKVKDGLTSPQHVPGVDNALTAAIIADAMEEATGNMGIMATGDTLALMDDDVQPPSSVESYADAMAATAEETGFRASDALTTLPPDALQRTGLSAEHAGDVTTQPSKPAWPRGQSPVIGHIDEFPFFPLPVIMGLDSASGQDMTSAVITHNCVAATPQLLNLRVGDDIPLADDIVLANSVQSDRRTMAEDIRSSSEELNTMLKDLQWMRKHYPVVAGRTVHVKKRISKVRHKKKK